MDESPVPYEELDPPIVELCRTINDLPAVEVTLRAPNQRMSGT